MNMLIATGTCSAEKNIQIIQMRSRAVIDPQQKFFRLFIEGLSLIEDITVTVASALPVSASTVNKKRFEYEEEQIGTVSYHYLPFKNGRIMRYITLIKSMIREVKKWCTNNDPKNSTVIVDPLIPVLAIPARIIAQKRGIKVGAIVTDIPSLTSKMKERNDGRIKTKLLKIYQSVADRDLHKYDYYIPLTESLNSIINEKKKPYCIVEGFADSSDTSTSDIHDDYVMYAGGVYEKFGLKALVEGFIKLNRADIELWIYGEGTYINSIDEINQVYPNIKYMGCVSPEEIVTLEKKAKILINPRPTGEQFAKYSFPSKTMEYLLSGTPVVSTRLPGIPDEYFNYIFALRGDDSQSISEGLKQMLDKSDEELRVIGKKGRDFVLREKNNVSMAKKIVQLCEKSI